MLYQTGRGVPQDYVAAVIWFRMAANQGVAAAQFNLGLSHALGRGVTLDYAEAYTWMSLAARQGLPEAQGTRDNLAGKMTAKQILEGIKRASAFVPKPNLDHESVGGVGQ